MKTKVRRKRTSNLKNTKKIHNKRNKITIDVDFTAKDGGFSSFHTNEVFSFLIKNINKGRNLIQTVPGKPFFVNKSTKLHLQAVKHDDFELRPNWSDIECNSHGSWLKSSPCKIGSRDKVFVKYKPVKNGSGTKFLNKAAGFGSYINAIMLGEIDEKKHIQFAKVLRKTMKKNPVVVHNMDVDWFHLKHDK
tara:strand:+ start:872 stop:1444 length:573 start_codon:yes stop_codon:yes gene_type:complete